MASCGRTLPGTRVPAPPWFIAASYGDTGDASAGLSNTVANGGGPAGSGEPPPASAGVNISRVMSCVSSPVGRWPLPIGVGPGIGTPG